VEAFGPRLNKGRGSGQFKLSGRWFNSCRANNKDSGPFPRAYGNLGQASAAKVVLKLGIVAMKSDLGYEPNLKEVIPCGGCADIQSE
jgi:hypothetical protein